MKFEVCIDSLEGALAADKFGADRVELCSALYEGGLTPGIGLVKQVVERSDQPVFVMIRPEAGGFTYSESMIEVMKTEIMEMANAGVKGVVFGVLKSNMEIDLEYNSELNQIAKQYNLKTVFHRAFDLCPDPFKGMEQIIHLGFDRLLTSGQQPKAIDGIDLINELLRQNAGRIEIMAGSGVNASNAKKFIDVGVDAIHFTGTKVVEEAQFGMGIKYVVDENKIREIMKLKN